MLWLYNQCQSWEVHLNAILTINSKREVTSFLSHQLFKAECGMGRYLCGSGRALLEV